MEHINVIYITFEILTANERLAWGHFWMEKFCLSATNKCAAINSAEKLRNCFLNHVILPRILSIDAQRRFENMSVILDYKVIWNMKSLAIKKIMISYNLINTMLKCVQSWILIPNYENSRKFDEINRIFTKRIETIKCTFQWYFTIVT